MNNTLSKLLIFAAGAVLGSFVTWKIIDSRYETIEDEPESDTSEEEKTPEKSEQEEDYTLSNKDLAELKDKIETNGYMKYSNSKVEKKEEEDVMDGIYVISPEEFVEDNDYETESLTYYTDGVITDTYGNIIDDPVALIGDGVRHFGEYEDDSVFVRNENNKTDYEILADYQSYREAFTEGH